MRLLIITQVVDKNDSVLGFFHSWIERFAQHFDAVEVLCLKEGDHNLPEKVRVSSLGKERGAGKITRVFRLYRMVWHKRTQYDVVLVHMNPIYIVLCGWLWKWIMKKPICLWYTHKSVDWKLKVAEKFSAQVFTASTESFRLESQKVLVTGHGIDTDVFKPNYSLKGKDTLEILFVGRISETKGLDVCLKAMSILKDAGLDLHFSVVGGPVTSVDEVYQKKMQKMVSQKELDNFVTFVGPVSPTSSVPYFQKAHVFVHASDTGSLDKVVLEAMACGTPVVSSSEAIAPIVSKYNSHSVFEAGMAKDLADKLEYFSRMKNDMHYLQEQVRGEVVKNHALDALIEKVSNNIKNG